MHRIRPQIPGSASSRERLKQPPSKKTALEDLLGGTFDKPVAQHISQIDAEMNKYRAETSIPLNSCPLKWWKENARLYPLLSSIAKAYLSTPATSVPSERVFSSAGDIVNVQRSQLLPENVDMLIFLKKKHVKKRDSFLTCFPVYRKLNRDTFTWDAKCLQVSLFI